MDCSPPGSSVHGILQARIMEWIAIPFCSRSSRPMDQTQVSCITGRFFSISVTREVLVLLSNHSVSDSLWPLGLQPTSLPYLLVSPRACSNSCLLSRWFHPTISSSVAPFSSCLQSFPESGSFPMSQLFRSNDQSVGASASASILPMKIQGWFPSGSTGLISLQSKGLSRVFSNTKVQKHQFFGAQLSLESNSHIHTWPLEKP